MTLRSHVKQNARRALDGGWGRAISILLICAAIYVVFSVLRAMTALLAGIPDFQDVFGTPGYFLDDVPSLTAASFVMELGFLLAALVVNAPLGLGVRRWYYGLSGGAADDVASIFSFFGKLRPFLRALWLRVNLTVRMALWCVPFGIVPMAVLSAAWLTISVDLSLLLSVLGGLLGLLATVFYLIAVNRYFLAQYLVGQYPDMTVRQAIRHSVREMKGARTEIFLLQISFLPWGLLCVFLLPILYVGPYYQGSQALYARYFIERARNAGTLPEAPQEPEEDAEDVPVPPEAK